MGRGITAATFLALIAASTGCDTKPKQLVSADAAAAVQPAPAPVENDPEPEVPKPPIDLPAPKDLPAIHDGEDLSKLAAEELEERAMLAALRSDFKAALAAQFWAVKKGAVDAQYNLACFYAQNQHLDEAIYWLQQAALTEGVDGGRAISDPLLDPLFPDPRCRDIARFLGRCNRYWQDTSHHQPMVFLPKGFDKAKPTPVVLSLYFLDNRPDQFCGRPLQELADAVGLPFICVTDARPVELYGGVGAGPAADSRVNAILDRVADRVTVLRGGVIALGFSTGAQLALGAASRDSDRYAGAILVTPISAGPDDSGEPPANLRARRFVLATNADPGHFTLQNVRGCRDWLDRAGANVREEQMDDQFGRKFTAAFDRRLAEWARFILAKK